MKFTVERDQILCIRRGVTGAVDVLFKLVEFGVGNSQGRRGGDRRLDAMHRLPQFQKAHLLQHHCRLDARRDLAIARRADEEPFAAGAAAQHAVLLQHPDRLAHGRAIDAERLCQSRSPRQARAYRPFAAQDALTDRVGDAAINRNRLSLAAENRLRLARTWRPISSA